MSEYVKAFDVCCIGETKLHNIPENEFFGHDILTFKQKTSLHGLAIFIKHGVFSFVQKVKLKSTSVFWVALGSSINSVYFVVGAVYIPGDCSKFADPDDFHFICEDILTLKNKFESPIILMGDFNARTGVRSDFDQFLDYELISKMTKLGIDTDRHNMDKKVDTHGRNLINLCIDSNFKIVNGRFGSDHGVGKLTCHKPRGKSTVDYCLVSDDLLDCISDFYVDTFDRCMSDVHSPICLKINLPFSAINASLACGQKYEKLLFTSKWKPELKEQYQNMFQGIDIANLSERTARLFMLPNPSKFEINQLVADLTSVILKPAKSIGLCKKVSKISRKPRQSPRQSWFDANCEQKRNIFFKAKNSVHKAKTVAEKTVCQESMDQKSKEYKQFISKHQKLFNKQLHNNLRKLHGKNPQEYWKLLKKSDGLNKTEPDIPMAEFENHFKNLNASNAATLDFDLNNIDLSTIQDFNLDFTIEEVLTNIKTLKNNKSAGADYVINEFLKNCPLNLVEQIVKIYNLILQTGHVPEEWSIGLIVPIFKKKGSKLDVNNYRGITLLSCLGKLFSAAINSRLTKFVEDRKIIGEEQAAFREGYSTLDHAFVLNELINLYLHENKRLYCCFIDYQKAFDTIERSALWSKVIANGINGKILRIVHNMYQTAKSCIKQETMRSGLFACNMGVRQGENLSPLLFALFLNDFEDALSKKYSGLTTLKDISRILGTHEAEFFINMYILLYADDTLILSESPNELQNALDEVYIYCQKWGLTINQTKTEVVIFSRGKVREKQNFKIGRANIKTSSEYCYLGLIFNFNGKLTRAIKDRLTPARKAMFSLNEKAVKLLLPPDIHLDLFDKMIAPILLYGSEIWGYGNIEPLELFHRRFLKRMLGIHQNTPNCIVYGEVGKKPLKNQIFLRMVSFWSKISEGKEHKLSTLMYKLIYSLHLNGTYHSPWLLGIKKILCNSGNPNFWFYQATKPNISILKAIISSQLNNQFLQEWNYQIYNNRRCIFYRTFKDIFRFEPYLKNLDFLDRRALCNIRTGSHNLPVTKQRYSRNVQVVVSCKYCNANYCDEHHILFECDYFKEKREMYIKKFYCIKPSAIKTNSLFNSGIKNTYNLAKFSKHLLTQFK